jgi:hypothetical protein
MEKVVVTEELYIHSWSIIPLRGNVRTVWMEWCCDLDWTTNGGVRVKHPDQGAKSNVGWMSSSSVPSGRKNRGQGISSRERTRDIHLVYELPFSASHEKEAFDSSFSPFRKHRTRSISRLISRHACLQVQLSLQSHTPPHPRLSMFLSVADKTSFPFPLEFLLRRPLGRPSPSDPFANSNLFPRASLHPITILSFLTARSPRQF